MMNLLECAFFEDALHCVDAYEVLTARSDPYAEKYLPALRSCIELMRNEGIVYGAMVRAYYEPDGINEVFVVYKAGEAIGFCADAQAMGFGDYIGMMVGVTPDHRIAGIRILTIAETPGIGMAVAEADYLSGYEGLSGPVTFEDGANHADAISGATYSSRAIRNGVNLVLDYMTILDDMSYLTDGSTQDQTNPAETEEVGNE